MSVQTDRKTTRIPPVFFNEEQYGEFQAFFARNPKLKKGETIKDWILTAIRQNSDIAAGKTQIDLETLRGLLEEARR